MSMTEINELIVQYGDLFYLITFIWAALEGETFAIFAGFAAQQGILSVDILFVAAWLGSSSGDQICFWIGRRGGTPLLNKYPKIKPKIERVLGWLESYAIIFILSYRFMYGVRNISSIAIGLSHLRWQTFAVWNLVAAFIWAIVFIGFGYFFGDLVAHMKEGDSAVGMGIQEISVAIFGLFAFYVAVRIFINHLRKPQFKHHAVFAKVHALLHKEESQSGE